MTSVKDSEIAIRKRKEIGFKTIAKGREMEQW